MQKHEIVWRPTPAYSEQSAVREFMNQHGIAHYDELLKRSEDIHWFWEGFIQFAGIKFYTPYSQIVDLTGGLPFPKWFVGGQINVAHNALDRWALDTLTASYTAVVWEGESGEVRRLSFGELHDEANRVANALQSLGIKRGDRVAIYMPMLPETVAAVFGVYKIGGVVVPLFSGFGAEAIAIRLADVEAKAVITADGFYRNGKQQPMKTTLDHALKTVPSVEVVIVTERTGQCPMTEERDFRWADVVARQSSTFETVHTDSEEVCMVSYSSGTSGKAKGIVQVHGGVAVKSAEFGLLNYDLRPGDVIHQITDFGWMMGQAPMLRAFSAGAALLLYEGSQTFPGPERMFELIEKHHVSIFGAPATALRILKTAATDAPHRHNLTSLRLLTHTGEPIDTDTWMWYFGWRDGSVPIINVSGGTELFAEILCTSFMKPLKPTCLGITPAIGPVIVDEEGNPVAPGTPGYLGFRLPQPAQTRGFWKESDSRYLDTYFPHGHNMWWHGDIVVADEDGFWFHQGRADDVLKVAGRRTGPGEIEDVVNQIAAIRESAVIGVPHPLKGEEIVVFAVPKPKATITPQDIARRITEAIGKPYEPGAVYLVGDLPKTRTAKIIRRLIKQHYLGQKTGDMSSLSNPEALESLPTQHQFDSP